MRLLARGRDADVFVLDERRVLRRYRSGRSAEHEARAMEHARAAGYPVPAVHDARGPDLVLERADGPTMAEAMRRRPWTIDAQARVLADLHRRLHAIEAPAGLPQAFAGGSSLLHLDLHPENVVITASGPLVIDWANAARGPAAADVAMTFVIVAGVPRQRSPLATAAALLRARFALRFLGAAAEPGVREILPAVAERRAADANLDEAERRAALAMGERARRGVAS